MVDVTGRRNMSSEEFVNYCLDLGYDVEEDNFAIQVFALSGRNKKVRNRIVWCNKTVENHFRCYSINNENPNKTKMLNALFIYAGTSKHSRKNR